MEYRTESKATGAIVMSIRLSKATCEGIHALFHWGAMGTWTDSQLIAQFLGGKEGSEPAFRVLIHRHGPMVLGICRRVLGDEHAAEDAFQVTFLVFVKKAGGLRDRTLLSNWLYGVAYRVAHKERAKGARRRVVERQAAERTSADDPDSEHAELRTVIDDEIHRLPERYRLPLVLCHLEGLRHDEAAQRLGCPVGTIESRLARGRERLRERLARRGLAPSASAMVALVRPRTPMPNLPALADATCRTVRNLLSHRTAAQASWVSCRTLVDRARNIVPTFQASTVMSTVVVCGAIAAAGLGVYRANGNPSQESPPPTSQATLTRDISKPTAPLSNPEVKRPQNTPPDTGTGSHEGRDQGAPSQTKRSPRAVAIPLKGISIDGRLDDWPNSLTRYPIRNQLLGHPSYDSERRDTARDPAAYFMAGYDRQKELVYLAVVVRDRDVVTDSSDVIATDAVEIYVDGAFSNRTMSGPKGDWWEQLDAATMPVLQYAAIPDSIPAYKDKTGANPSLVYGKISRTATKMKFHRIGEVTTYEWAVQAFDHYPGHPSRLRPGKRLGLEVAVLDKDRRQDRPTFLTWGSPPVEFKGFDAGSLGELVLAGGPED
jgi:RNA polymerase sigma factor (sigma-70 family)